jgi:pimeloyl-ACP methyl ester carboxylesterase
MRQTVLDDPVPRLRTLDVPVLLLWGERDALIPVSNAQDYLAALPRAALRVVPATGHVPQEESPAESVAMLRRFLGDPGP